MKSVGHVAMNEAIKLQVESFSFAPSIKDAGITSIPTGDVSIELTKGMISAFTSAQYFVDNEMMPPIKLKEVIFLAGVKHLENSQAGIKSAIEQLRS